jgi:hypothetical protein
MKVLQSDPSKAHANPLSMYLSVSMCTLLWRKSRLRAPLKVQTKLPMKHIYPTGVPSCYKASFELFADTCQMNVQHAGQEYL